MNTDEAIFIGRRLLYVALILSLPTVLVSLVVGLTISIFQTVTSIQEQTLTFAPRIVAVAIAIAITLPWTLHELIVYTEQMLAYIPQVTR